MHKVNSKFGYQIKRDGLLKKFLPYAFQTICRAEMALAMRSIFKNSSGVIRKYVKVFNLC